MSDLFSNFFPNLLDYLFSAVGYLTNILLSPINAIILTFIPANVINQGVERVSYFWSVLTDDVNWIISFFGLDSTTLLILKYIWVYILSAPLLIGGIKLAVSWFRTLKFQ